MITSRLMSLTLPTRSSSLARPSGLSTALSKSKKASAAYVTLVAAGGCGAGAGRAAAGGGGAGCAAGAGGGAGGGGTRAPSQPWAAVAGVQLASRRHSSLVPFFHTSSLVPLLQLSICGPALAAVTRVCAPAAVASAAAANISATWFSFFMVLLLGKKPRPRGVKT